MEMKQTLVTALHLLSHLKRESSLVMMKWQVSNAILSLLVCPLHPQGARPNVPKETSIC